MVRTGMHFTTTRTQWVNAEEPTLPAGIVGLPAAAPGVVAATPRLVRWTSAAAARGTTSRLPAVPAAEVEPLLTRSTRCGSRGIRLPLRRTCMTRTTCGRRMQVARTLLRLYLAVNRLMLGHTVLPPLWMSSGSQRHRRLYPEAPPALRRDVPRATWRTSTRVTHSAGLRVQPASSQTRTSTWMPARLAGWFALRRQGPIRPAVRGV